MLKHVVLYHIITWSKLVLYGILCYSIVFCGIVLYCIVPCSVRTVSSYSCSCFYLFYSAVLCSGSTEWFFEHHRAWVLFGLKMVAVSTLCGSLPVCNAGASSFGSTSHVLIETNPRRRQRRATSDAVQQTFLRGQIFFGDLHDLGRNAHFLNEFQGARSGSACSAAKSFE